MKKTKKISKHGSNLSPEVRSIYPKRPRNSYDLGNYLRWWQYHINVQIYIESSNLRHVGKWNVMWTIMIVIQKMPCIGLGLALEVPIF